MTEQTMRDVLGAILKRYVDLVNSGDAGFWDPESEEEVKAARAALVAPAARSAHDDAVTPEMLRAAQLHSELGTYATANLVGAYDMMREMYSVMHAARTTAQGIDGPAITADVHRDAGRWRAGVAMKQFPEHSGHDDGLARRGIWYMPNEVAPMPVSTADEAIDAAIGAGEAKS